MSFTHTLYEGDGCMYAMLVPANNAASSLVAGPGALEMKVWTRRIDLIWAAFESVARWYRHEPKQGYNSQIESYRSDAKARAELGRSLRDLDRGAHLPV